MTMATLPAEFADLEPFSDWCLEFERERYAKRLASTMDEMQAFYDAAFPRLEAAMEYLDQYPLDALPDDAHAPAVALLLAGERVVPRRGVAPAVRARQRRRQDSTSGRRTRRLNAGVARWKRPTSSARRTAMRRAMLGDEYVDRATSEADPPRPSSRTTSRRWRGACGRAAARSRPRDRSLLVMAMTAALGRMEEFRLHARSTAQTGVTDAEIDELLFQIAAYCGAPAGVAARRGIRAAARPSGPEADGGDRRLRRPRQHGQRARREPRARRSHRRRPRRASDPSASPRARRHVPTVGRASRARADVVVLSLPDGAGVGVGRRGDPRRSPTARTTHVVDTSTIGVADRARPSATLLADDGIAYVDAPVSGGVAGARARTLAVMYAASDDACAAGRAGARRV